MSVVFIVLQATDEALRIADAILADNPGAAAQKSPGLVKVDAEGSLTVRRATVAEHLGRDFDLQEIHLHLITITGHLDEDDDQFTLAWR
jgi:phenol/toluene 2-monooxygenase (NADH) P2/A2